MEEVLLAGKPVDRDRMPRHVAIIMDGNGRWAKKRGMPRGFGHKAGVEALREIIRHTDHLGIPVLTIYAFSQENWKRSNEEVGGLMSLLLDFFAKELRELDRENVRIRILGDVEGMPEEYAKQRRALREAERQTARNTGLRLCIALNYGAQQEILRACRLLARECMAGRLAPEAIDKAAFEKMLYTEGLPEVDLLIRTSGEMRISNFLLWQIAYAEIVVTDTLWPDFDRAAYDLCLLQYLSRDRRFGGVKEAAK